MPASRPVQRDSATFGSRFSSTPRGDTRRSSPGSSLATQDRPLPAWPSSRKMRVMRRWLEVVGLFERTWVAVGWFVVVVAGGGLLGGCAQRPAPKIAGDGELVLELGGSSRSLATSL